MKKYDCENCNNFEVCSDKSFLNLTVKREEEEDKYCNFIEEERSNYDN